MMKQTAEMITTCPCGCTSVHILTTPRARFYCHCTICQAVSRQAYADDCLQLASNVHISDESKIEFRSYKSPPAFSRGICKHCQSPVIAFFSPMPFIRLAFIPSVNYPPAIKLPKSKGHMFYRHRVAEIDDALPKYEGYWSSQLATAAAITRSLFCHRA